MQASPANRIPIFHCFRTPRSADLASDDFDRLRHELSKVRGPVALGNEVQRTRMLFRFGYECGLIDKPVRYGPDFRRPSKKTLRLARHSKGPRMFEAVSRVHVETELL
jgi:hypothetical protein